MLKQLLEQRGFSVRSLQIGIAPGGVVAEIKKGSPKAACIVAVPPFAYMHTRYLCRRLRHDFTSLKLISSILSENGVEESRQSPGLPSVDDTASSLRQTVAKLAALVQERLHKQDTVSAAPVKS